MDKNEKVAEETLEEQNIRREKELMADERKGQDQEAHEQMQDVSEALSVRDRLIARARSKTVKTIVEHVDEEGTLIDTIEIESRMLTGTERARVALLFAKLTEFAGDETGKTEITQEQTAERFKVWSEVMESFCEVAAEIVVTSGLTDYFRSGKAADGVITRIVTDALLGSMETTGDTIKRFQPE